MYWNGSLFCAETRHEAQRRGCQSTGAHVCHEHRPRPSVRQGYWHNLHPGPGLQRCAQTQGKFPFLNCLHDNIARFKQQLKLEQGWRWSTISKITGRGSLSRFNACRV